MKIIQKLLLSLTLPMAACAQMRPVSQFGVINIIPNDQSGETDQNSEPSIGVGTGSLSGKFVVHSFGPKSLNRILTFNPYYTSSDGGIHWATNGTFIDAGVTLDWSAGGTAYAAALSTVGTEINVFSSPDPTATPDNFVPNNTAEISGWLSTIEKPWLRVVNVNNVDHIFFGFNDLRSSDKTASVRFSLDGGNNWSTTVLEKIRPGAGRDSPAVRLALPPNGRSVYALFQRWFDPVAPNDFRGSVVLVRDDHFGGGGFNDLPNSGTLVANNVVLPWGTSLGLQWLASGCDVAVNPSAPNDVYVAYTEVLGGLPVLRVQHSSDSGANFTLVYSRTNASLPALAITKEGMVGLLFAALSGINLEIHFFKAYGGDFSLLSVFNPANRPPLSSDRVLASFPNAVPRPLHDPYIGNYFDLKAVGYNFYGTFCAYGQPEPSHFPSGVYYQRNVNVNGVIRNNFTLNAPGTLVDLAHNTVPASIDPFFFFDIAPLTLATPNFHIKPPLLYPPPDDPRDRLYRFVWPTLPDFYPPFQAESSPTLGPLATWAPATNHTIMQTNGEFALLLDQTAGQEFFRLSQDVASGQFQIFTFTGRGGTLSPSGADGILAIPGTRSAVFTATPNADFGIGNWYLDGMLVQHGNDTLAITNIVLDHTVQVTFVPLNDIAVTVGAVSPRPEQPFLVGTNYNYVVTVQNTGLNPAPDIAMSDPLPDTVAFVSATASQGIVGTNDGVVQAVLGGLEPGASATVTITVVPQAEGTLTNIVNVAYDPLEPDWSNNSAEAVTQALMPVSITNQPASQDAFTGDTVTFSVGVSGTPPISFQWSFNGAAIAGATGATLRLENVTFADEGVYFVTVSQVLGPELAYAVNSQPAILTLFGLGTDAAGGGPPEGRHSTK